MRRSLRRRRSLRLRLELSSCSAEPDLDLTAYALQGGDTAGSLQEGLHDVQGVDQAQYVPRKKKIVSDQGSQLKSAGIILAFKE